MNKLKVYCDLDQTVSDLTRTVLAQINRDFGLNLIPDNLKHYHWLQEQVSPEIAHYWNKKGLYDSVPLFPQAQWFVECLNDMFDFKIITHCQPAMKDEKQAYVKKWFGLEAKQVLCVDTHKHFHMEIGSVLIDDYLLNIQPHIHYNKGYGILFNHYNEVGWAKYDDNGQLTSRHLYASTFHRVIQLLKGIDNGRKTVQDSNSHSKGSAIHLGTQVCSG